MHETLLRERHLEDTHIRHVTRIQVKPRTCINDIFTKTDVRAYLIESGIARVNLIRDGTRVLIHSPNDAEKSHNRRVRNHKHGLTLDSLAYKAQGL